MKQKHLEKRKESKLKSTSLGEDGDRENTLNFVQKTLNIITGVHPGEGF